MKKILIMLVLALAVLGFAQDAAPGPNVAFQAFEGASFLKIKPAEDGFHKFSLKVEAAPWAFQAIGEARVVAGDPQLLVTALYEGSIYVVVAYTPNSKAAGKDGKEYNAGVFDLMLYYDDEQVSVRNVKFKLLPPADDEWAAGILKDAMAGAEALGALWGGNYEHEITAASATPVDKKTLQDMNRPKPEPKPVVEETPAEEETPLEKRKKRKMVAEEEETDDDGSQLSVKEKRRRAMMRKKQAAEEEEEAEEPVVKKKKKKKKAVEEDEEEAPVVKKKKKKKKVVEEDAEEDEEPVVKKKKKKKKVVEEEEEDDEEPVVKKKKSKKKKKKKSYDEDEEDE
ncbi:MAG: hypothetical protein MJY78_11180 [Fibrobacter sp.]|nr:hypothetical protein [Fibrobacter sp.]